MEVAKISSLTLHNTNENDTSPLPPYKLTLENKNPPEDWGGLTTRNFYVTLNDTAAGPDKGKK